MCLCATVRLHVLLTCPWGSSSTDVLSAIIIKEVSGSLFSAMEKLPSTKSLASTYAQVPVRSYVKPSKVVTLSPSIVATAAGEIY